MPKTSRNKKDSVSKQTGNQDKKGDMPASDKVAETINPGRDDDDSTTNRLITNFVIHMNGSDVTVSMFYNDHFYADLETEDVEEMHNDMIIDTIYERVVYEEAFEKMLDKYDLSERRDISKLFNRGRDSNELHRAFYFENADRKIIINRKKKTDLDISIKRIYETSHAVNNDDTIVFDFNKLLVNMVTNDEKLYDKIVNIWDEHRRERDDSKNSKIVFVNDIKNRSHRKITDQDDTDQDDNNRDVADQGTTTNNRKVVNNRADQEKDMNTDTPLVECLMN